MSAFIVSPAHIGALAAFAAHYPGTPVRHYQFDSREETAMAIGRALAQANVDSVFHRYGEEVDMLPCDSVAEYLNACALKARKYNREFPNLPALSIIKMAKCLDYQSCEYEGWEGSDARQQVDRIISKAINLLPGYDDAPWDWEAV
jgi:hypothetical protein